MAPSAPTLELLSVHVPKCGGTSLGNALRRVYADGLLEDYGDRPGDPASPMNLDPEGFLRRTQASLPTQLQGKRAVHGHFHAKKYQGLKIGFRTAIIREPVARLVSHYYYWKIHHRADHQLHNYFLDQHLDLEDFARLPFVRYFYTRVFFGGLKLDDFDYVGTLEAMPGAVAAIARGIGHPLELAIENQRGTPEYRQELAQLGNDSALRGRLAALLADDIRFYDSVRSRWT